MKKKFEVCDYCSRTWLNRDSSPSTGSIVCYDGTVKYADEDEELPNTFIEISDCHGKIRLHRTYFDTKEDFVKKIDTLIGELNRFKYYLE